ncbi:hypothetical protein PG996_014696 [Apiospora saccharicola]|uniref:RNA ligase domain-containing protein n=1 Tax=Apiospora saccharicola TaxID=335842 RepID=A0ABR1TJ52_9PEZI
MSMYVGEILAIDKIAGQPDYETAMVSNLPCVVKAGKFKVEEHVMVFPVDTIVFVDANDAILEYTAHNEVHEDSNGVRGLQVKPIMVHGQVSAGLVVKLSRFPSMNAKVQKIVDKSKNKDQGNDKGNDKKNTASRLTWPERIWQSTQSRGFGVAKFRPKDPKAFLGERPAFVPKTTAPFIDESPEIFWNKANWPSIWQATPAMPNRMPMFIYMVQNDSVWAKAIERRPAVGRGLLPHARMGICGETNDFRDIGKHTLWDSISRTKVPSQLGRLKKENIAIECVMWVTGAAMTATGPRPQHEFRIFAVWDIDEQKRMPLQKTRVLAQWLGLSMVPDLGRWGLSEILMGEAARADLGVVYMSQDGQTVMRSRPTKNAPKLKRNNIWSLW